METTLPLKISKRSVRSLLKDGVKAAKAVNLMYVTDKEEGISRKNQGKAYIYVYKNQRITNKDELQRIRSLVIPPAWQNVWICKQSDGHLQVTGTDARNRKQYKYHSLWNSLRNHTKFYHLYAFGKVLPSIRQQLNQHLSLPGLPLEKVLATVVTIMEQTSIRIGNGIYEKLYGSFGLTTLKDKHVNINGNTVQFSFKGKKGVYHSIELKSKKLAHIIKQCRDIPGKELFQYYNDKDKRKTIDSGIVNDYIKTISHDDFTAKDFRTWIGTVQALLKLKEFGCCNTDTEAKKKIAEVLDHVSKQLGNTRTICKKYYVHPLILELYTNKSLEKYWRDWEANNETLPFDLKPEERVLMKMLETN